jgi:hypothetical protein
VKGNEVVWRTLADAALLGRREWENLADLGHAAGTPPTTAALAVRKLHEIGAVEKRRGGGIVTVNPEKVVLVLSAWRNLAHDTITRTTMTGIEPWLDTRRGAYALGGSNAAITYVSGVAGRNTVASHPTRLVYLSAQTDVEGIPDGDEVIVLRMDKRAEFDWHAGVTSRAQTYADLFALPGWQAEEFRRALHRVLFPAADWEQSVGDLRA